MAKVLAQIRLHNFLPQYAGRHSNLDALRSCPARWAGEPLMAAPLLTLLSRFSLTSSVNTHTYDCRVCVNVLGTEKPMKSAFLPHSVARTTLLATPPRNHENAEDVTPDRSYLLFDPEKILAL